MEETEKNLEKLETAGKIVFGVLLIAMPTVSVCSGYSKWWLIGYVAVAMGSVQALAACRLKFEHVAGLLIADAVLAVAVIVSFFASSIWIPIVQIAVSAMAGGSMHNLLEEQNKAKKGGGGAVSPSTVKKYDPEPLLDEGDAGDAERAEFGKFVEFVQGGNTSTEVAKKLRVLVEKKNVFALNWLTKARNTAAVDEEPEAMRFLAVYYMTTEDPIQYGRIIGMAAARKVKWAVDAFEELEKKYMASDRGDFMVETIIETALKEGCHCKDKYTERCLTDEKFYIAEMDKQHLKSLFAGSARHENPEEMKKVIAELQERGCFDEVIAEVRREAADSPEASFTFGYYLFIKGFEEKNSSFHKWGVERIAKAARQDYRPAMKVIARCFNNYLYGNVGAAEKAMLKGILDIASQYCSPEYCAQQCGRFV